MWNLFECKTIKIIIISKGNMGIKLIIWMEFEFLRKWENWMIFKLGKFVVAFYGKNDGIFDWLPFDKVCWSGLR